MIRLSLLFCISILSANHLFADIIDEFTRYSYDTVFRNQTWKFSTSVQEGEKTQVTQMIVSNNESKVIYVKNKLQRILFLVSRSSDNTWMISDKAKRPLKITQKQSVTANMSVQDFAGMDIRKDFVIEEKISENEYLLRSIIKRPVYPYTTIKKEGGNFFLIHRDKNRKPYKEVLYSLETINGKTFWQITQVRDLVFQDVPTSYLKLWGLKTIRVPATLFSFHNMSKLFVFFQ